MSCATKRAAARLLSQKMLFMLKAVFYCLTVFAVFCSHAVLADTRVAVKSDVANIRSGPNITYDVLWQVEKYHPLMVIDEKGQWYRFRDFEGDQGWIHDSLVDKTETVIVKVERCNVRTGPGTENDVAFTVDKGIPFKVIGKKGRWLQVRHADGDSGWIFNSLLW